MKKIISFFIIFLVIPVMIYAASFELTFTWDKSICPDLEGYKFRVSNTSMLYDPNTYIDVPLRSIDPNVPILLYTIPSPREIPYYFAVTAYDIYNESDFSNEVTFTPDLTPPADPTNLEIRVIIKVKP